MRRIYCIVGLFILFLISGLGSRTYAQSLTATIDSLILRQFTDMEGPGAVFLVARNGKPVYHKAFGKSSLELGVNLDTGSVFQIGSMTKQFTAVAILMLMEQGKLHIDDSISKFIPGYPGGDRITIHHLLTHTSGIKDFTRMKSLQEIALKEMTPKAMMDFFKDEPVDFKPGEKFEYNNSGYILLGYIIELVSGETYEDFIREHIFKKIGMSQSRYATDRLIIMNRASGYQKNDSGYINKTIINYSLPFASGSLMSTTGDLLKWQNALNQNQLVRPDLLTKAFTRYRLNNGDEFTYGYGWHLKELQGKPSREHGGSIFGFKSMGVYIPAEDIYVIGLSNCSCNSPTQLTRDIAAAVLTAFSGK